MSARTFDIYKPKRYGNVMITHNDREHYIGVTLHDTVVVRYYPKDNEVHLDNGGWFTVTSKTAINTALRQIPLFARYGIFQSKNQWYIQDTDSGVTISYHNNIVLRR